MIIALDHIAISVPVTVLDGAVKAYETLLGHRPAHTGDHSALFSLGNMAVRIEGDHDSRATAELSRLAFRCPDLSRAERVLARRGVTFKQTSDGLAVSTAASHGVPMLLTAQTAAAAVACDPAAVIGLDHVVIRTPNPERAVALYAGRLGLDLRLDRTNPEWGARLLFFVCGDLVVELVHDLKHGVSDGADQLWGLSWRAADIERLHARLTDVGVAVSKLRQGRRPNTRVFTVENHTVGVPTLVIGGEGLARQ